jgi:hypothetical protein
VLRDEDLECALISIEVKDALIDNQRRSRPAGKHGCARSA